MADTEGTLHDLMQGKQSVLLAKSKLTKAIKHPTTKGDITEKHWARAIRSFLPTRYVVSQRSHILDCNGETSSNIDLIIHDGHYCPLFFEDDKRKFIPAESVYATFEVKQDLNKKHVEVAGTSAEGMRAMHRTNAPVRHIGGVTHPRPPFRQIAGILTLSSDWSEPLGPRLVKSLGKLPELGRLDLGCALRHGAFVVDYETGKPRLIRSTPETSLVFFLMELYTALQALGTVPAIDLAKYARGAIVTEG